MRASMLWGVCTSEECAESESEFLLEMRITHDRKWWEWFDFWLYGPRSTKEVYREKCDKKKRYHHVTHGNIWEQVSMTEQERFFDHKLYGDSCEIRDKAIGTEEDEGSDERIGKYGFCFFDFFLVSGSRDHIESSKNEESYDNWSRKVESKSEKLIPDDSEFTEEVSLRDDTSPDFYESKKQETKDTIDDTTFCFFLYFFVAS